MRKPKPEIYTQRRKAEFLINNSVSKEDYDSACLAVHAMGLDPASIRDMRDKLLSDFELSLIWDELARRFER